MVIGLISVSKAVYNKAVSLLAGGPFATKSPGVDNWARFPADHAQAQGTGYDRTTIDIHSATPENDLSIIDSNDGYGKTMGQASSEASDANRHGRTILAGLIEALSKMPGA